MRVTFPHMGTLHLTLETLFQTLGLAVVTPPRTSKETLELGMKYSPEFACLPLKLMVGNFIQAIEQGADTIVMCGGCGPCRLGHYAQVQQEIIQELGYDVEMIVLEANIGQLIPNIRRLAPGKNWREIVRAVQVAWEKMQAIDLVEQRMHSRAARAVNPNEVLKIYEDSLRCFAASHTKEAIMRTKEEALQRIAAVPNGKKEPPLRVGIVGELFVALEPLVNQELERHLIQLGVEVERTIYVHEWVQSHLLWHKEARQKRAQIANYAKPYLGHWVGGHGLETIGHTVRMGQEGFDGIIQVFPFTCMPEIVAKSILPKISEEQGIPVMTLVLDEHAGEAGIMTRLEAFVDLMARRRCREERSNEYISRS